MAASLKEIDSFNLPTGYVVRGRYRVEDLIGAGREGEVYRVTEIPTGLTRAAKLFFPQGGAGEAAAIRYARKLDRLRTCRIVTQYHHAMDISLRRHKVPCLISEYFDAPVLDDFLACQRGGRLQTFEALHLFYALVCGVEEIHKNREFHGDLHSENILVNRRGIYFDVKSVDFHDWGQPAGAERRNDILDLVRLLVDLVGGRARYASQPREIKTICQSLRRDRILANFPNITALRTHLESFEWS